MDDFNTYLNEHSGLLALLAFIAAVFIPIIIYRLQKRDQKKDIKAELDAMNDNDFMGFVPREYKDEEIKKRTLQNKLKN